MIDRILRSKLSTLDKSEIEAIGLMGSYSIGDAKRYSDIDLVCILKSASSIKEMEIEFVEGKYVVTSFVTIEEMEKCFINARAATENILGLQKVWVLYDPNNTLNLLKQKALNFRWTKTLQINANEIANNLLMGWIEEVHKALQGLISNDIGRMLNGLIGLTYGLFKVVSIQKGILLDGENSFYEKVTEYFGKESKFTKLSEKAFGITTTKGLEERVIAGLLLFNEVTDELTDILTDKEAINLVKMNIKRELMDMKVFIS